MTHPLTRRDLLRAGAVGAAGYTVLGASGCGLLPGEDGSGQAATIDKPNLLLIIVDSLRNDHVGAYGGRHARTPSLDALARESLVFTRMRPESMPTIPVRRAVMTGRRSFPFRGWHPVRGLPPQPGWSPIPRDQVTFTQLLRRAGYTTGYITDNPHILSGPYDRFRRTFDATVTIPGQVPFRGRPRSRVSSAYVRRRLAPEQRAAGAGRLREYFDASAGRRNEDDFLPARVFRGAIDFLEAARERQPFALVVDSFDAHEPWDPPDRWYRRYTDGRRASYKPIQPFESPSALTSTISRRTLALARALYAGEVSFVDHWVGNLLDKLDELGLAGSTWVVMLSDHGVLLGERGFIGKSQSQLFRELYRVPMMIRHPEGRLAGRRSDYFASTHDVAPTLLRAAGAPVPRAMTGENLTRFFNGRRPSRRSYWTCAFNANVMAGDDRWLLISDNQGRDARLYDNRSDPRQRHDVASRHPGVVRRLFGHVVRDAGGRRLPRFD